MESREMTFQLLYSIVSIRAMKESLYSVSHLYGYVIVSAYPS